MIHLNICISWNIHCLLSLKIEANCIKHDVIIIGGGLSGVLLALQLKNANDHISILVLEKSSKEAIETIHKVGGVFWE